MGRFATIWPGEVFGVADLSQSKTPSAVEFAPNRAKFTSLWQISTDHQGIAITANLLKHLVRTLERAFLHLTQPSRHSIALTIATDLTRSRVDLIAENALLRQQLIVLHRRVKKPRFTQSDRLWLVLLASRVKTWKDTLLILKPDTLLSWHRQGFRLFWKFKSRYRGGRPRLATETIRLIQQPWVTQRLREATPFGQAPRFLIRDRDGKYGQT